MNQQKNEVLRKFETKQKSETALTVKLKELEDSIIEKHQEVCTLKDFLQVEKDKNIMKDKELSDLKSLKVVFVTAHMS